MSGAELVRQTYLPDPDDQIAAVHDFLAAHEAAGRDRPAPRFLLAGSEPGDQVEIPPEVYRVLRQIIEAMRANLAVTVVPETQTLTTQQAADLLGVSRPTVIKLLDDGKIPCERIGAHRRLLLRDLLSYRERRRAQQYEALAAMRASDENDPATVLAELKDVRREVARRRRGE